MTKDKTLFISNVGQNEMSETFGLSVERGEEIAQLIHKAISTAAAKAMQTPEKFNRLVFEAGSNIANNNTNTDEEFAWACIVIGQDIQSVKRAFQALISADTRGLEDIIEQIKSKI